MIITHDFNVALIAIAALPFSLPPSFLSKLLSKLGKIQIVLLEQFFDIRG